MLHTGLNFLNWYGPQAQLVVTDPELVKEIMNNREGAYPKTQVRGYVKKIVGDGLAVTSGENWYKLRKLANHAFYAESLKSNMFLFVISCLFKLDFVLSDDF